MSVTPAIHPLGQESRLRSLADFYMTTMRTAIQTEFQYRAATYMYLFGMVAEPVIYLVVWSTIADQSGGMVGGLTAGDLGAYYIVWTLVRTMNIVFTPYGWEWRIREGQLSGQLLRPLHPIHYDIAQLAGGKIPWLLYYVPIAVVLTLAFDPTFDVRPFEVAVFAVAIWGAYLIRTFNQSALGMVTFWTTRVGALFSLYILLELLSNAELVAGLGLQVFWIVVGIAVFSLMWKHAIRRYTAVGN